MGRTCSIIPGVRLRIQRHICFYGGGMKIVTSCCLLCVPTFQINLTMNKHVHLKFRYNSMFIVRQMYTFIYY
jgi:hypothetical protein